MAYKAPYDERNEADYLELSKRIEDALTVIENDLSVPTTANSLASLAICSRGTLYSRGYPLDRLRQIKKQRLELRGKVKSNGKENSSRVKVGDHVETISELRSKLELSDQENAILVQRCIVAEAEVANLNRTQEAILSINKQLESEIKRLSKESALQKSS